MNDKNTTKPKVRRFSRQQIVPCPRCYHPLPEPDALCESAGCRMQRDTQEEEA